MCLCMFFVYIENDSEIDFEATFILSFVSSLLRM